MRKHARYLLRVFRALKPRLAAVKEMELDLPATSAQFSMSLAIFILVQGVVPLAWSAISEIKGRRVGKGIEYTGFALIFETHSTACVLGLAHNLRGGVYCSGC